MTRAHRVQKSAKVYRCHAGHDIPAGQPYYWAKPGFRVRRKTYACTDHPFKQSQLTSGLRSEALAAAEAFEATLDAIDTSRGDFVADLESAVEEFASAIEDYVSQRQDALDAWENGNSQLEELLDIAQSALDEIQGFQVDEWPDEDDLGDAFDDEDHEDHQQAVDSHDEWTNDQLDAARELANLEF